MDGGGSPQAQEEDAIPRATQEMVLDLLAQGLVSKACRCLISKPSAEITESNLYDMREKHPKAAKLVSTGNLRKGSGAAAPCIDEEMVRKALASRGIQGVARAGCACNISGTRPSRVSGTS